MVKVRVNCPRPDCRGDFDVELNKVGLCNCGMAMVLFDSSPPDPTIEDSQIQPLLNDLNKLEEEVFSQQEDPITFESLKRFRFKLKSLTSNP